jgi:predicted regulator of Ras-like GTPase activity (Roadblock/LC7/MglB family)
MVKKKSQETATALVVDESELSTDSGENQTFTDLCNKLAEIRKEIGVTGYIIRNTTHATIDLKESEKIVDYAIFSSQVLESARKISDLHELGDIESIFVEGKETNALCMTIEGNIVNIFMEKNADKNEILKRISP